MQLRKPDLRLTRKKIMNNSIILYLQRIIELFIITKEETACEERGSYSRARLYRKNNYCCNTHNL